MPFLFKRLSELLSNETISLLVNVSVISFAMCFLLRLCIKYYLFFVILRLSITLIEIQPAAYTYYKQYCDET